jgi:hypothetical protein
MPRRIVVFDTNIYLALGIDRTVDLTRRQRAASVISGANIWAVAELSSHLGNADDPHFGRCLGALRSLWQHCKLYDGTGPYLPFVSDTEEQLCTMLFGRPVPGREAEIVAAGAFVRRVATSESTAELAALLPTLTGLRGHIARVEAEFVDSMSDMVRHLDPAAQGWETFRTDPERRRAILSRIDAGVGLRNVAEALVKTAGRLVGATLEGEAFERRVDFALATFGTPIHFFDAIVRKLVDGGIDMSKPGRANSIWDLQIAFYGLPGSTVDGAPLVLVTDEHAIHRAAAKAGDASSVMYLRDFTASLG